jgi:hypothetical protein
MSIPLATAIGAGHAQYLIQAADRVAAYLKSERGRNISTARRGMGQQSAEIMGIAILRFGEVYTGEDIEEVARILDERGVVP